MFRNYHLFEDIEYIYGLVNKKPSQELVDRHYLEIVRLYHESSSNDSAPFSKNAGIGKKILDKYAENYGEYCNLVENPGVNEFDPSHY